MTKTTRLARPSLLNY